MRSSEAIERVLELDEKALPAPYVTITKGLLGDQWFQLKSLNVKSKHAIEDADINLIKTYRTLCPRLAKALRIAMQTLKEIDLDENADKRGWSYSSDNMSCMAENALTAIERVFE